MRTHTIATTTLALLLSLLALGALGLVACGEGDDEGSPTEAKVSADTTTEATGPPDTTTEAKLSRQQVQELKREANTWASLFAVTACNRYMGQPMCERLDCVRHVVNPIENCTPVSAAFQKSFADATVEDIKSERIVLVGWTDRPLYEAAVKFSNGEVVVFADVPPGGCPGGPCKWGIADHNRRFLEAAAPRQLSLDKKSCGTYERWRLVVEGDISCPAARRVMRAVAAGGVAVEKLPGSWICTGPDGHIECYGDEPGIVITARF